MERERLSSRLGFILLSAGCAIGCGNVWKFPWMVGQNGGAAFVLIYFIFLALLGLPALIMEFSLGRASQASPVKMYQKLERPGQKWHIHGYICLFGNIALMAFYTVVTGWFIYYFVSFLTGHASAPDFNFVAMISNAKVNIIYLFISVALCFAILTRNLQSGLERITKVMMFLLLVLMTVLAVRSITLPGGKEGLAFYLVPDFKKIKLSSIVSAMNQAFFTLSLGIGAMAIFGSYIGKEHSLMGESIKIIILDTFVAITAGLIIFPACSAYGQTVDAGPSLLFNTMTTVFNNMAGGRIWGSIFFLFMIFAAFSTELTVCENILACVRELTGWSRLKGCLICGTGIFLISLTTALGYSVFHFQPFAEGTAWLDFWDFIVSNNLLPLGSLVFALFWCTKLGAGWPALMQEANEGKGMKVKNWMKIIFAWFVPICIIAIYIIGLITFNWK